jgi:hypothetical protein
MILLGVSAYDPEAGSNRKADSNKIISVMFSPDNPALFTASP